MCFFYWELTPGKCFLVSAAVLVNSTHVLRERGLSHFACGLTSGTWLRIQRYWLDSGSTLLRQSTELSLNFTHFPREDGLGEMTEIFLRIQRCVWFISGGSSCITLWSF